MTNDKVNEVLTKYSALLNKMGMQPERYDIQNQLPLVRFVSIGRHTRWMCVEATQFPPEKLEKKMRWLGFIQGVLWTTFGLSIEDMKKDNMPDDEKPPA